MAARALRGGRPHLSSPLGGGIGTGPSVPSGASIMGTPLS
jgi:hypothetical protein